MQEQSGGLAAIGFSLIPVVVIVVMLGVGAVVAIWALLSRGEPKQGEPMERPSRVGQLYGYAVCLIAVVVFLISVNSFVNNLFTLSNPLRGNSQFGEPSVSSFEGYRSTVNRFNPPPREGAPLGATADSILRSRYEALRIDRIEQARFEAERGLTTSGLLIVISVVLFLLHWRWLRAKDEGAT